MVIRRFHRLGRKLFVGSGTLTGLLLGWTSAGPLAAQPQAPPEPAAQQVAAQNAAPVQRNYLNKSVIQLPIEIKSEVSRALISEIQLYVKDHPNAPWTLRDKVGSNAKAFNFQVPRDGEYWFAMVTMDKQGRGFPNDLRNEQPGLVVVIDTQAPQIDLTNLGSTPDGQLVQCDVKDANLDNTRTRFFYQGGDRVFRALEPMPGRANVYCIPPQAVFTGVVRATAEDMAGNQSQREGHLNQIAARMAAAPIAPGGQRAPDMPPPLDLKKLSPLPGEPRPFPMGVGGGKDTVPVETPSTPKKPATNSGRPDGSQGPRWIEHTVEASPVAALPTHPQENLKRQFVNNTKVFLDYQVENAGQAGVGKVEVWITRDRAKTWQKLSEETQRKSQLEIQFPGEGIFGVTLVATSARGVAGTPPAAGDAPDWWIEVDTTKPALQLTKIHSTVEDGKSVVHIHWNVQDKNLSDAPVELFYGSSPQGPWLPIAKGLKSEGQHRWDPPVEAGAKTYLRLVAQDAAGNSAGLTTQDAVQIEEPVRPRAMIRGITTGAVTPVPLTPLTPPTVPQFQIVQPPPSRP